tara:strand:+ start:89 stop:307 length:219 start_codon:yes stop_codon:yes gene_type:complete
MKFIIINLLAITTINPLVNAHENHDHEIYNWSNSKSENIKTDSTFNVEKLEDKKNKGIKNNKSSWIKIFRIK